MIVNKTEYYKQKLLMKDFLMISSYIERNVGIRLPKTKMIMVQSRLIKRLIAVELPSFNEYVKFVFSPSGKSEIHNMINVITTNKTDFFRELAHFEFLSKNIIGKYNSLKIWSAGCSTGEEPYSVATHLAANNTGFNIYANDISKTALEKAKAGIYSENSVKPLPSYILKKYFTKNNNEYLVNDEIKKCIDFSYINLIDDIYNLPKDFDIIFFRNVLTYFDKENKIKVLNKMANHLKTNGYLILGLSENILWNGLPYKNLGYSIYQKI